MRTAVVVLALTLGTAACSIRRQGEGSEAPDSAVGMANPRPPAAETGTSPAAARSERPPALVRVRLEVDERWQHGPFATPRFLSLPAGFRVQVLAAGLDAARFMALDPQGVVYVSLPRAGQVLALEDRDRDGVADSTHIVARELHLPHGLAFYDGALYVAETGRILRQEPGGIFREVASLPEGGGHWTRTLGFGPDGRLYVSAGSSCNVCQERDPRRAAILRFEPDGSGGTVFARGLRNAVGFTWHPLTGEMWATENGRDLLGDDIPPDEINRIEEGRDYGWPRCHGTGIPDPEFGGPNACDGTVPATIPIQAHSAPLGLRFYPPETLPSDGLAGAPANTPRTGETAEEAHPFPAPWNSSLFVALHGSWNRSVPTGYKVIAIPFEHGKPAGPPVDFLTGFLTDGQAWGRPVDVLVAADGALLVSDDRAGAIYRITWKDPHASS